MDFVGIICQKSMWKESLLPPQLGLTTTPSTPYFPFDHCICLGGIHQFHVGWLHQSVRANHGEIHHLKSLDSQSPIYEPNNIPKILRLVLKMESYTLEFLMCPGKMSQKRTANRPTTAATWNTYQLVPKAHWRKKQSRNRNPVRPVAT